LEWKSVKKGHGQEKAKEVDLETVGEKEMGSSKPREDE
jgi:hypothetical protein